MVNFAKALLGACALVSTTSAFPAFDGEWEKFYFENFDKAIDPILKRIDQESWNKIAAIEKRQQATFNEDAQRVDVSGEHEYRPPTEGKSVFIHHLLNNNPHRSNPRSLPWTQHPF